MDEQHIADKAGEVKVGANRPSCATAPAQSELGCPTQVTSKLVQTNLPQINLRLRLGAEALQRLRNGGKDWADWCCVLEALGIGRHAAMLESGANKPRGYKYNQAFGKWLRCHEAFQTIDKADRKRMFEVLDNLPAIEEWRGGLPPKAKFKLNYPPSVLKAWKASLNEKSASDSDDSKSDDKSDNKSDDKSCLNLADYTEAEITAALAAYTLERFLQVMPAEWCTGLQRHAGGQVVSILKQQQPNVRLKNLKPRHLKLVTDSMVAAETADTSDTKPGPTQH